MGWGSLLEVLYQEARWDKSRSFQLFLGYQIEPHLQPDGSADKD